MLYTKISLEAFLVLKKNFRCFLPYTGMMAILFNDEELYEQIDNMPSTEGPNCNLVKIGQAVSAKKMFKDYEILNMYIAQRQGQIAQEDKILIIAKRVCYFQPAVFNTFSENDFTTFSPYKSTGMQI